MKKKDLIKRLAYLESLNDQLMTELTYLDELMRQVGFAGGIESFKETALEMYQEGQESEREEN